MSSSNCCFLTYIRISQEAGQVVWYSHLFKNFPQFVVIYTVGFPCGSAGKESACNAEDLGLIPGLGRPPREGKGYPFQYFGLENSMECIVHGIAKSWTQLSDFHTVKSFGKINKAEVDVFLELSCFFDDRTDVGNLEKRKRKDIPIWMQSSKE